MSNTTLFLTPSIYNYLIKTSLKEHPVLKQLRDETEKLFPIRMQIAPEQGQFMRLLIEIVGAKKTIDIGTFTGYSALIAALALPKDGKVITCDINKECTDFAKRFWEVADVASKIDLRLQPALQTLDDLIENGETNTFDFIFIDADKRNYPHYYEKSLTLLRQGGLIAVDNVLWSGRVADSANNDKDTAIIRELNSTIFKDDRVSISMLPMGDGLTLVRKK